MNNPLDTFSRNCFSAFSTFSHLKYLTFVQRGATVTLGDQRIQSRVVNSLSLIWELHTLCSF